MEFYSETKSWNRIQIYARDYNRSMNKKEHFSFPLLLARFTSVTVNYNSAHRIRHDIFPQVENGIVTQKLGVSYRHFNLKRQIYMLPSMLEQYFYLR